MNVINVGFNSKYWNVMVEASDDYNELSNALDNENSEVATIIMKTIKALLDGDGSYNDIYRIAHEAVRIANGNKSDEGTSSVCPFCDGEGTVFYSTENSNAPWEEKEDWGICDACNGKGSLDSSELFTKYAGHALPEHVIMSVVKGDMKAATDLAREVMREILSHESDNIEKSMRDGD